MIIEILLFLLTTLVAFFFYANKNICSHFERHGVKYLPTVPLFGNMLQSVFNRKHVIDVIDEIYRAFPDEKYVGMVDATTPIILVRDPELIKTITVKDFDHFVDHRMFIPKEIDTLFGGSVFLMKGDKWRDMRTTLSPAFTGAKMKHMMPFMTEISNNIVEYLKENKTDEVDVSDLIRRYTNDVIASAGFGFQVNSVKDRDNEFYVVGQRLFQFSIWQRILILFGTLFPEIVKRLGIEMYPRKQRDFFRSIVSNTIEFRQKNNMERPDMIQLLMEASKGTLKNNTKAAENDDIGFATVQEELRPQDNGNNSQWTLDELAGQVSIFFVAGYESVSTALVMSVHELAVNLAVQEKMYQEIREFKERRGNLSYDKINELKFMDSVLSETLRRWSGAIRLDRICTKAYELPPSREGGKPYLVKPGDTVYNVVNSIHLDPKYFPDPYKFDPERFSDENKHGVKPYTFMPFGMGPRNCIGSRFAILELKVFLYNLVLNFKILKCSKTTDPIILQPLEFNIKAQGGSWVRLEARN